MQRLPDIQNHTTIKKLAILSLAALGVVYGDIGTSPLYALNEMFFGHARLSTSPETIIGSLSLVFWALTLVVAAKYIILVLKADNQGEGGIFALYSLLAGNNSKKLLYIMPLLIFAAGLLFGDGMITPAISVISAVEGLKIVTKSLESYIVPVTIIILTGLFLIQKKGTALVGSFFGPIITIWFIAIGFLGLTHILGNPEILNALNPAHALKFLTSHEIHKILIVLGSVMLVVTGGEALYADMGHFGRKPIRLSWFSLVYPALILNYLGQGAYLLSGKVIHENNIFYSLAPSWFLIPLVILATAATIIASQALISGAFSLAVQGTALGLFPPMKVKHTHHEHKGQIYVPLVNWLLYIGTIAIVLVFQTSTRLAAAYGLAVSGVMFMTSIAMLGLARYRWGWGKLKSILVFAPFAIIDAAFLSANSLKFLEGGFIPFGIGIFLLGFMLIWQWGRGQISKELEEHYSSLSMADLVKLKEKETNFIPRSIVIMTPKPVLQLSDPAPALKQIFWKRYGLLPHHLIFLTVNIHDEPYVKHSDRFTIKNFYNDPKKGGIDSVIVSFGFMEELDVEKILIHLAKHKDIDIDEHPYNWLVHVYRERLFQSEKLKGFRKLCFTIFKYMLRSSTRSDRFFGLGRRVALTMESIPITIE